jgi:predicted nucleic acid-binding Zn ribbon protein
MALSTYNIYQCHNCNYLFDAEHAITVSIKSVCVKCNHIMDHVKQIDYVSAEEQNGD